MTTGNSRADALTDLQIMEALEAAGVKWQAQRSLANDREILTYGSTPAADIIAGIRTLLAASPVEQPAAAPIEKCAGCHSRCTNNPPDCYAAPSPADERAAFEAWAREEYGGDEALLRFGKESGEEYRYSGTSDAWAGWQARAASATKPADERAAFSVAQTCALKHAISSLTADGLEASARELEALLARASSANETGAEGADALAHEVWSAAQRAPGEGIEDAVQRIAAILSRSPNMAAEAVSIPAGWKLVPAEPTPEMLDCWWDGLPKGTAFQNCTPRGVYAAMLAAAPQPAQADARVGLTDEQRDVLTWAIGRANAQGEDACADVLRSILASQPGRPEPRAEVTEAEISAAARVLSDSNADLCYVDRDDNWKIHGDEFRIEAKTALEAAAAARTGASS
ncbi:hypothetical protein [Burkholderia sp. AU32262]|uniref:hypothetical protein n=1 Tax=Burkholderia sp. AU32262 TaxID=2879630 RepID=UPI001CF0E7C5|nr:hypothetical protein [Burkholderia sp. AU32262]MCA8239886.1 hypothetical protein [Burkholderia sp. AU32262]